MPERESDYLSSPQARHDPQGYFLVMRDNGKMFCSCGRPILRLDDGTFMCSAGYPQYRPGAGDILIDKFGNLMFRQTEH